MFFKLGSSLVIIFYGKKEMFMISFIDAHYRYK